LWWYTSIISALKRVRQEDLKFEASLEYIARPCLKKPKNKIERSVLQAWLKQCNSCLASISIKLKSQYLKKFERTVQSFPI
jgi:hypothetical protein